MDSKLDKQLIIGRFFAALYRLKGERKFRGIQTFCHAHDINRRNLYKLEHNIETNDGIFNPAWLTYLVRDHDVSAHWLLTGEGSFYRAESGQKAQNQRKNDDLFSQVLDYQP